MRIIETHHFMGRWAQRVGGYSEQMRKLIQGAAAGRGVRRHRRSELGLLVPLQLEHREVFVVGMPTTNSLILRTVLDRRMASRMGWK